MSEYIIRETGYPGAIKKEIVQELVRCNQCKHYEGVHGVQGHAPCAFWGIEAVMWDDFCKRGEMWDE